MSQVLPEVLDYRDIVGKLERIDSEWESLKDLLTFKSPYKDQEPANRPTTNHSQTEMHNKVVGFPKPGAQIKPREESQGRAGAVTLTPGELGALSDGNLMLRFAKVERHIRKLTILVGFFISLAMVLGAIIIFQGLKNNAVNRPVLAQPQEMVAPANPVSPEVKVPAPVSPEAKVPVPVSPEAKVSAPVSPEAKVSAPESPATQVPPLASESHMAPAQAAPTETVVNSPDTAAPTAIVEPAPKFVGSITSNKIHLPDCKWAKTIRPERLITFPSIDAARKQGYVPCPVCRPQDHEGTN